MGILFTMKVFFRINIGELVAPLKFLPEWKLFLVSCGRMLELCTNFRGLKWGINFWFRSERGYGKSQILV